MATEAASSIPAMAIIKVGMPYKHTKIIYNNIFNPNSTCKNFLKNLVFLLMTRLGNSVTLATKSEEARNDDSR